MAVVILQPGYLPWLGFFDQMHHADIFVYYDDVQFDKNGWRNRNRVKSPDGTPFWLTVPVQQSGRSGQLNLEVEIHDRSRWPRKHIGTLQHFYAGAPFRDRYLPRLEALLEGPWKYLVDLDIALIEQLRDWLGIQVRSLRASNLDIGGGQTERLLSICNHFGATKYVTGSAARDYLNVDLFHAGEIEVVWQDYDHPVYRQLHGDFVPYLSVVDLLFNHGPDSLEILVGDTDLKGRPSA